LILRIVIVIVLALGLLGSVVRVVDRPPRLAERKPVETLARRVNVVAVLDDALQKSGLDYVPVLHKGA